MAKTQSRAGFTLIDIMVTICVMAIVMAMAVPALMDFTDGMRLGQAQRDVYQEMQSARLIAVASNRPIVLRLKCPTDNEYRITELIGSTQSPDAKDTAIDRCDRTKYPYPAADVDPTSRPNHDGPVRTLPPTVAFSSAPILEFWPDGTVHKQEAGENPWKQVAVDATGVEVSVVKNTIVKKIRVNGLGKIQLIP